jgi:hypothetical protein
MNGTPQAAPEAPEPGSAISRHLYAVEAGQRPEAVNPGCTPRARNQDEKVPCLGGCGKDISAANKSGRCRDCWVADGGPYRNAMARRGEGDVRKTEPEAQAAMLNRMAKSFARRAAGEDPGRGLALLLDHLKLVTELTREVGIEVTETFGQTVVAQELGTTKQNVDKRWGATRRGE